MSRSRSQSRRPGAAGAGGAIVLATLCAAGAASGAGGVRLVDRTAGSGIEVVTWSGSVEKPHILESTGNGVLVLDYDGDGYPDLYFAASHRLPRSPEDQGSRLYRGLGDGTFEDVTVRARAGLPGYGQGGCVADVDADGDPDLYLTAFGRDTLLVNGGDGTFSDRTADSLAVPEHAWSIGCAFFDADADGDPDLYVARYIEARWKDVESARRTRMWRGKVAVMDGPRGLPPAANAFFLNDGTGRFREATREAGFEEDVPGYSMDVAAFDFDRDGRTDLYVANDSTPNRLFRGLGSGRFEEVGAWTGSAFNADGAEQGSMGIAVADFDGDGWLDLVVTNFARDYSTLYRNLEGRFFEDASFASGMAVPSYLPLGWAALPLDADLDGDPDLFLANGHIYPQVDEDASLGESFRQPNQLLLNEHGKLALAPPAAAGDLGPVESSRGGVVVDLDNDGDDDLVIGHQDARPTLLANETASGHGWLGVALRRDGRDLFVPGARFRLETAGRLRTLQHVAGSSYASQSDPRLRFGLGGASGAARLEIEVPGRWRLVLDRLEPGSYYVIELGSPR